MVAELGYSMQRNESVDSLFLEDGHRIVNTVVDSLDVRIARNVDEPMGWLATQYETWRDLIDQWQYGQNLPTVEIPNIGTFQLMSAKRHYEFLLINKQIGDIRIWNPDKWKSGKTGAGQVYLSFRSFYLQHFGLEGAESILQRLEDLLFGPRPEVLSDWDYWKISRGDMAVDIMCPLGLINQWADIDDFVCEARKLDVWLDPLAAVLPETILKDILDGKKSLIPPLDNKGDDTHDLGSKAKRKKTPKNQGVSSRTPKGGAPAKQRESGITIRDGQIPVGTLHQFALTMLKGWESTDSGMVSRVVSHGRSPQTVYFGRFGGKLYARAYNKLATLLVQNKLYMQEIWAANGWDGKTPVWRIEFSMSGDFFKQIVLQGEMLDCRVWETFLKHQNNIWHYLTHNWLQEKHAVRGSQYRSKHTNQWKLKPRWSLVQRAWSLGENIVRHKPDSRPDTERNYKQIRGLAISIAAGQTMSSLDDAETADFDTTYLQGFKGVLDRLQEELEDAENAEQLIADVKSKLDRIGRSQFTDTELSALFRAQKMEDGDGS